MHLETFNCMHIMYDGCRMDNVNILNGCNMIICNQYGKPPVVEN